MILSDIDFRTNRARRDHRGGNVGQRLQFQGGRYGIMATSTSPFWPYTPIDSTFEGQREAAIREHQTGLTVAHDVPRRAGRDQHRQGVLRHLWLKDTRFENVATAAVVFGPAAERPHQIGAEDVICVNTPVFARERESGRTPRPPSAAYRVRRFSHGLFVGSDSTTGIDRSTTPSRWRRPAARCPARAAADGAMGQRGRSGAGDGKTDDTKALQAAIDGQRVLLPDRLLRGPRHAGVEAGHRADRAAPATARLDLADRLDAFAGVGEPKRLLQAPSGGRTIVSGLGLFTGATNPRATAVLWMAGRSRS